VHASQLAPYLGDYEPPELVYEQDVPLDVGPPEPPAPLEQEPPRLRQRRAPPEQPAAAE